MWLYLAGLVLVYLLPRVNVWAKNKGDTKLFEGVKSQSYACPPSFGGKTVSTIHRGHIFLSVCIRMHTFKTNRVVIGCCMM